MGLQRQHKRIKCKSKCILMEPNGDTHEALVEDMSFGGALIKVNTGVPNCLQVDDLCSLMLCSPTDPCPTKISCRVVRHDSVKIGVRFLTK
jgi:c-di-GMP-binding flagellar brake protein YcgR